MKLFVTIYNDARLLGHFLRHYDAAGIRQFFIAAPAEFCDAIQAFTGRYDITLVEGLDVVDSILGGTSAVSAMRARYQGTNEWAAIVDLDEFVEFPTAVGEFVTTVDRSGANVVRGVMYDRFNVDGRLADFAPDSDLAKVYPVKARFIRNVMGGSDTKGVLVKGRLLPAAGAAHHRFEDEKLFTTLLEISHYKWFVGAIDRLRVSHRLITDAGISWSAEHARVFAHYDRHGRFVWQEFGGALAADYPPETRQVCIDCAAPVSEAEFAFSVNRFGKALCRLDQKKHAAAGE